MTPAGSQAVAAGADPTLSGAAVHVWRVDLDAGPADATGLSDDEHGRARRMTDERVRGRFLASRGVLRAILGDYLGVDPAAVRYDVAGRGKPSIVGGGGLCFSLSRSADVALVALTRGRPVGVDVERIRPDLDHAGLAERFFSPAEAEALRHLPERDRVGAFFGLWVAKEAVVKASGAGLADGIGHLDVRGGTAAGRWSVVSLEAGPGLAAAVAVDGLLGPISVLGEAR